MNIFKVSLVILLFVLTNACKEKQTADVESTADTTEIKEYFPVYDFLSTEISSVDSLAIGLKYYNTTNQKIDSGYISHDDFHKLASSLIPLAIRPEQFKNDFKETSFYDRSTKTSTFMYNPVNQDNPIKRIDILTKASDTYDKVSTIYMEYVQNSKDSSVLNKMIWKTGRFMQLNQQVNFPGKQGEERQIKVVWNNWEEIQ